MQPENGFGWFVAALKDYAKFSGRARRREFWYFGLFSFFFGLLGSVFAIVDASQALPALISLGLFIPSLAVTVRRLHDTNHSGWWVLAPYTVVLLPLVFYFCVVDGEPLENRFGPCPKSTSRVQISTFSKASIDARNIERLEKLASLRDRGVLTDEEFKMQKAALL